MVVEEEETTDIGLKYVFSYSLVYEMQREEVVVVKEETADIGLKYAFSYSLVYEIQVDEVVLEEEETIDMQILNMLSYIVWFMKRRWKRWWCKRKKQLM